MQTDQQYQQWSMMQTQQQPGYSQQSHHHHQPQTQEEIRTLWIGDLQYWMDENYVYTCFAHTNEIVSVKLIRNKITGHPEGYGFVEFMSHPTAEKILQTYSGTQMPQTEQPFRLNWASFGLGERRPDGGPEHSIFVGDLAPDITDYVLQETFRVRYLSVKGAKVVIDVNTGRSKGYGFVRFGDESERSRAMTEMNGVYCSSRPMRISAATPRKAMALAQQANTKASYQQSPAYSTPPSSSQMFTNDTDPNNTTIFVGGLDQNVTDEDLRQVFGQFGELVYVKIPHGKGCGFVQYTHRSCAEEALQRLHGTVIGQQAIRLSWGRSLGNKQTPNAWGQAQPDPSQWNAGYYGYGQGYDNYGYSANPQDAGSYCYEGYGGYGNYPQQMEAQAVVGATSNPTIPPTAYHEEEIFDPLAPPDIDKLNASYIAVHEASALGRHLWLKTSEQMQAA